MAFTAKDVQALRERTSCGMMDCKKALTEAGGDMEKAVELLREKGLAAAAKKAGRIAAEGMVLAEVYDNNTGVIIEVNSETDFVAKNADFRAFVKGLADVIVKNKPADVAALSEMMYDDKFTVTQTLQEKILTIGENLSIRRFKFIEGNVVSYTHGGGRIGVLVEFDADESVAKAPEFIEAGKDVAMQVAALNPSYLDRASVPDEAIEKEKEILIGQIKNDPKNASKPQNIIEKMVSGRIGKFYQNNCLVDQAFVKNGDITVGQYISGKAKDLGGKLAIKGFIRYEKGEGLQKKEEDFAAEIAKLTK
jgi:elongation factor Ts